MPVLPLVGSIKTVLPGVIFPAFSASLIMLTPIRSLTLAQGLKLSSFATTVAPTPSVTLFRRTSGVLPMRSVMSLAIFMSHLHWIKTVGSLGKFQGFQEPQTTRLVTTTTAAAITEAMHVDTIIVAATMRIWPAFRHGRLAV